MSGGPVKFSLILDEAESGIDEEVEEGTNVDDNEDDDDVEARFVEELMIDEDS